MQGRAGPVTGMLSSKNQQHTKLKSNGTVLISKSVILLVNINYLQLQVVLTTRRCKIIQIGRLLPRLLDFYLTANCWLFIVTNIGNSPLTDVLYISKVSILNSCKQLLRSTKWNANLILLRDYAELVALCKVIVWKTHIPVRTQK